MTTKSKIDKIEENKKAQRLVKKAQSPHEKAQKSQAQK